MSWLSLHRSKILRLNKKIACVGAATALLGTSVIGAFPTASAYALDTSPSTASIDKTTGQVLYNTDLLQGSVADVDGVQSTTLTMVNSTSGVPISASIPVLLDGSGGWSLQLTKNTLSPVDLANSSVRITLDVTDQLANITTLTFGPFHYSIPDTDTFHSVVEVLAALDPNICPLASLLQSNSPMTVFGPNNEALAALPAEELQALLASPDELCSVVSSHIIPQVVVSTDITSEVSAPSVQPDTNPLVVRPVDGSVVVNETSIVVNADNALTAGNILHVINALINPVSSAVNINDVTTNSASPALTGTITDSSATIVVRVNGVSYQAVNNGDGTWVLPAGIVSVNPKDATTLFTVIARKTVPTSDPLVFEQRLVGLTMRTGILHYIVPVAPASAVVPAAVSLVAVVAPVDIPTCDATCIAVNQTSSTSTTIAVTPDQPQPEKPKPTETPADTKKDTTSQWYWWLIGIATLGALYYVLGGGSPAGE